MSILFQSSRFFRWLPATLSLVALLCSGSVAWASPPVMLWSWQKVEDLRVLNGDLIKRGKLGVAYLTGRIIIDGDDIDVVPRLGRLDLPVDIFREAVVRIEVRKLPDSARITDRKQLVERLVTRVLAIALRQNKVDSIQIDFDARLNQRQFYAALLRALREKLPASVGLNMTALASWVMTDSDNWMSNGVVPVDSVVPMFFTMGLGRADALEFLSHKLPAPFKGKRCIGLSVSDDRAGKILGDRLKSFDRVYLFSSSGWKKETLNLAGRMIGHSLIAEEK